MRPFLDEAFVLLKGGGRMALYLGKAESKGNRLPDIVDSLSESVGFMRDVSIPFVTVSGESNRRRKAMRETYVQVWRKG
jgi:predicted methyltransferase